METADWARALGAVHAIARQLDPFDADLGAFGARLTAALASVASARGAALFRLEGESLNLVAPTPSFPPEQGQLTGIPCRRGGDALADRIVFGGHIFRGPLHQRSSELAPYLRWIRALRIADALIVQWRTGDAILGAAVVYGSLTPGGFMDADEPMVSLASATAGLIWQQRELAARLLSARAEEGDRARLVADRAIELEEMKRRILNLAAHELRGPITVLRGYLSMLEDGSLDERSLRRILPILVGKAAQMDGLVTQMLEVARLDEGRLVLQWDLVDLTVVARETIDVAGLIAPPGVSVFLERPPGPVVVNGDRNRLATIVANLVDNAIKYSPAGGLVHCAVGIDGAHAFVTVKDQGLGIARADMPQLFTRFGRIVTPENSHIPGTGLGLHLSRELAQFHGGEIGVSSEAGRGSQFTLWLPLVGKGS